jgi:hypothetical protein
LIRQTWECLFYQLVDGIDVLSSNGVEETDTCLLGLGVWGTFLEEGDDVALDDGVTEEESIEEVVVGRFLG